MRISRPAFVSLLLTTLLVGCAKPATARTTVIYTPRPAGVSAAPSATGMNAGATVSPKPSPQERQVTTADANIAELPAERCQVPAGTRLSAGEWHDPSIQNGPQARLQKFDPVLVNGRPGGNVALAVLQCNQGGAMWADFVIAVGPGGALRGWTELPAADREITTQVARWSTDGAGASVTYRWSDRSKYPTEARADRALITWDGTLHAGLDSSYPWHAARLTAYGFGGLKLNMTVQDIVDAGWGVVRPPARSSGTVASFGSCSTLVAAGEAEWFGLRFDTSHGRLSGVWAGDSTLTLSGAYNGISELDLQKIYGNRISRQDRTVGMASMPGWVMSTPDGVELIFPVNPGQPVGGIRAHTTESTARDDQWDGCLQP